MSGSNLFGPNDWLPENSVGSNSGSTPPDEWDVGDTTDSRSQGHKRRLIAGSILGGIGILILLVAFVPFTRSAGEGSPNPSDVALDDVSSESSTTSSPNPVSTAANPEESGEPIGDSALTDYFSQPKDLEGIIAKVQESTVTIYCGLDLGSGWVLELGAPGPEASREAIELDEMYPYEVVTNHHVVKNCLDAPDSVQVVSGSREFDAYLYSWDEETDLALVGIAEELPPLVESTEPQPGWWAMAVGSPYELEGSVTIGNIINRDGDLVISTAALNSGNSGGPLVNSRGEVIGTNSAIRIGDDYPQDWNIALAFPVICNILATCPELDQWD